jgi:hypothetical protein
MSQRLFLLAFSLFLFHATWAIPCQDRLSIKKYQDILKTGTPELLKSVIGQITGGLDGIVSHKYASRVVLLLAEMGAIQTESVDGQLTGQVFITGQGFNFKPDTFVEAVKKESLKPRTFLAMSETQLLQRVLKLPINLIPYDRNNDQIIGRFGDGGYEPVANGGTRKLPAKDPASEDEANPTPRDPGRVESIK